MVSGSCELFVIEFFNSVPDLQFLVGLVFLLLVALGMGVLSLWIHSMH